MSQLSGFDNIAITADITEQNQIGNLASSCPILNSVVHCVGVGDRTLLKMVGEKDIVRGLKANFDAPVLLRFALLKKRKILPEDNLMVIASRTLFVPTMERHIRHFKESDDCLC